jgi:hypothetical protein
VKNHGDAESMAAKAVMAASSGGNNIWRIGRKSAGSESGGENIEIEISKCKIAAAWQKRQRRKSGYRRQRRRRKTAAL